MTRQPTRRDVLQSAAFAPLLWPGAAPLLHWLPRGDDRCLLVLELQGGNDGLNTVIPTDDGAYQKARPTLSKVRGGAHDIGDGFALHPSMAALRRLVREDHCAIVHGVGYDRPDRSHFRSRDIWHTADPTHRRTQAATTGWLGRAADWLGARGAAVPGLGVGGLQVPLVLRGRQVVVPLLRRIEDYQLWVDPQDDAAEARRAALLEMISAGAPPDAGDLDRFISTVARSGAQGAERLRASLAGYRPGVDYPETALARQLQLVARVVVSGFGTRLFHVGFSGFDTHARQAPAHAGLLQQLSTALAALLDDLQAHDHLERMVVLVHSEFGRRVAENQSLGTDHGAAGPLFLLGGGVRPGLHGKAPDLTDLRGGDLRSTLDFRRPYGECLRWLGVDEEAVLGSRFDPVGLLG